MGLIDSEELAALAEHVESAFDRSRVEIYHHTVQDSEESWDDSVEAEIADDATPSLVVNGWLRNQPDHQVAGALGAIAHEEDSRLFVPLGTVLERQDKVVVYALNDAGVPVGDGTAYRVIDTNIENSFKVLVRASLMRIV